MMRILPVVVALMVTLGSASNSAADARELGATPEATPHPGLSLLVSMTIMNEGCMPDRVLSAETPIADQVLSYRLDKDSDISEAEPLEDGIDIPAGGKVELSKNGVFLLLSDLTAAVKPGDTFALTLTFTFSIDLDVYVTVRDPAEPDRELTPAAPATVDTLTISEAWAEYATFEPEG